MPRHIFGRDVPAIQHVDRPSRGGSRKGRSETLEGIREAGVPGQGGGIIDRFRSGLGKLASGEAQPLPEPIREGGAAFLGDEASRDIAKFGIGAPGGALGGAMLGSAFGPVGTAIGALAGLGGGIALGAAGHTAARDAVLGSIADDQEFAPAVQAMVANLQADFNRSANVIQLYNSMMESGIQLPADLQRQFDVMQEDATFQLEQIDAAVREAESLMATRETLDPIFANRMREQGIRIPDMEALAQEREAGEKLVAAVERGDNYDKELDDVTNAQLDVFGLEVAFDRASAKAELEREIRNQISNLTTNRRDIERQMSEAEFALRNEAASRLEAQLPLSLATDATTSGMGNAVFSNFVLDFLSETDSPIVSAMAQDDAIAQNIGGLIQAMGLMLDEAEERLEEPSKGFRRTVQEGLGIKPKDEQIPTQSVLDDPQVTQEIGLIAEQLEVDPGALMAVVREAHRTRRLAISQTQAVLNPEPDRPVSISPSNTPYAYGFAVYRAGLDVFRGPDAQDRAEQMANSPSLAAIIQAKSGGRAGIRKGGDQRGIGGLSPQVYEQLLGVEYGEIEGNALEELRALIMYVDVKFGGRPEAALQSLMSGDWGDF